MEPVVFGLHTAEVKKWITQKEANVVKAFFGVNPSDPLTEQMYFYPYGIIFWIEEVRGHKPRFYLRARINFARATGFGNYLLMPYTVVNIRKAITSFNKILKLLRLSPENAVFADWTVERFDSAFDIQEPNKRQMIKLLNLSLDLSNGRKKCERKAIIGKTQKELLYQSMRFGNASFIYNIYDKEQELLDKGKTLTKDEELYIHPLIRVERQNHEDAVKKLLSNRSIKDLLNPKTHDAILRTMIDEVRLFFGNGDFYTRKGIEEKFSHDCIEDIDKITDAMTKISSSSIENEYDTYKQVSDIFERFKISPVGISRSLDIVSIRGLYNRIIEAYPRPKDKRQYNNFPVPHMGADGRYRAVITLYFAQGKKRISIADGTLEGYETKVFERLKNIYLINRINNSNHPAAYAQSADSILRFSKTIKSKKVKQEVDNFLETFSLKNGKNGFTK